MQALKVWPSPSEADVPTSCSKPGQIAPQAEEFHRCEGAGRGVSIRAGGWLAFALHHGADGFTACLPQRGPRTDEVSQSQCETDK